MAIPWEPNDKRPLETCLKPKGLCHWPWGDPWGFLEDSLGVLARLLGFKESPKESQGPKMAKGH